MNEEIELRDKLECELRACRAKVNEQRSLIAEMKENQQKLLMELFLFDLMTPWQFLLFKLKKKGSK